MNIAPKPMIWRFPAPTTHDGLPLGNGLFGALLWGQGSDLRVTINRADFWDHRGGTLFGEEATYANLRRWLTAGDEATLRRVFEGQTDKSGATPPRPTRLPMGRLDLNLGADARLGQATLDLACGCGSLSLLGSAPSEVQAIVPRHRPVLAVRVTGPAAHSLAARSSPPDAPEVLSYQRQYGYPEAQVDDSLDHGGWVQELPSDSTLCVYWKRVIDADGSVALYLAAEYGESPHEARRRAEAQVSWAATQGFAALSDADAHWWRGYWRETAQISLPDSVLQELYELGMYKLPGISWPGTPAATLQGPWVEEYRLPPWSCDYHFNINVQECYWPAYSGNQIRALEPLWELIRSWVPKLQENARQFLGIDDGLMLNHAVDDRCTCMGGFWTGSIDHGSTAWVAQMMWQYYRYTLDNGFLVETAYPFMQGSLRAYEAMLERQPDGSYALPVSVSPEYEGSAMSAWGRNASFQLAIIHFLCGALVSAAEILHDTTAPVVRWRDIAAQTPRASLSGSAPEREIILWDGQPLAHSHRHHSHLAGLYPFDVYDPWGDEADRELMVNSMRTWTRMGKGEWSGWCLPWASILWSRMHQGERAALILREFRNTFMTQGRASTHDAVRPGFTVIDRRPDVMQIEATMGAAAAVLEMLAHTAFGVLRIFPAIPQAWDDVRFDGLRTEGAFLVSAERVGGHTRWVRILSTRGSHLSLAWPFGELLDGVAREAAVRSNRAPERLTWDGHAVLERNLAAGEELYLTS